MVDSSLVIVGLSSRTASSSVRERFWMDEIARSEAATKLTRSDGISEALVLVTKSRVEFVVWADDPSDAANSILQLLSQKFGLKLCEWEHFYRVTDTAAIAHVFSLACETADDPDEPAADNLQQLNDAWKQADAAGTSGPMLDALFAKAVALADRINANTLKPGAVPADMIAAEAKSFRKKLLADRVTPAAAVLRVRVEEICRHEMETFERALGPMNEPQRNTLNEVRVRVTKRIGSEVEHELKELKQIAEQQNMSETAQRLLTHRQMHDAINRSQN
jgi:glutamyl-tRNA reductase